MQPQTGSDFLWLHSQRVAKPGPESCPRDSQPQTLPVTMGLMAAPPGALHHLSGSHAVADEETTVQGDDELARGLTTNE